MSQWQYMKLDLNEVPRKAQEIDPLNHAGKEGWELVTIVNGIAYLKREVPAQAPGPKRARSVGSQ
jgi:hypothetical protein